MEKISIVPRSQVMCVVVCDRCCYGADLGKAGGEMEIVWSDSCEAGDVGVTLKDECGGFIGHFSGDDGTKETEYMFHGHDLFYQTII